jgi:hypothetical protein
MPGRTVAKWMRVYVDAFDLSGYTRSLGTVGVEYEEADLSSVTDPVRGAMPNLAKRLFGPLDAVLDNTALVGTHLSLQPGAGTMRTVTACFGDRAAPVQGVPAFMGQFEQQSYMAVEDSGAVTVHAEFENSAMATVGTLRYPSPWGWLLHPLSAETAANTAIGIDDYGAVPPTLRGGYMAYHISASNGAGTVVVKVQHASVANTDGNFSDVAGLATSAIGFAAIAAGTAHGVVPIGAVTISRWTRWQIVLAGGMTTATFALAFVRGY